MREFLRARIRSFGPAFAGWFYVLRTQANAWIHAVISVAVIALSVWLGLSRIEWVIIIITLVIVWTAEFINTAIEALVDLQSPNIHPLAKAAKDIGAAAVLIAAIAAGIVGILILGPPLWARIAPLL